MAVLSVDHYYQEGTRVYVEAVVDDMRVAYPATYRDPEELAPALCSASFDLDEDNPIPVDEDNFCSYLSSLDLPWLPVDTSDTYL